MTGLIWLVWHGLGKVANEWYHDFSAFLGVFDTELYKRAVLAWVYERGA